ncbi:hypothetical protein PV08_00349 [Exophiala spinifera]|uniref:CobW/HypB/UreG nucleotide-binding domain-containing protein n=1 Tax=Exophiala spinifera TaxID=91928 RepID=A0A0D2BMG1_9EURO|nr:uncharacterized protein PV08_00349 [Exophiala spinifera]KIW19775.1 hypothetical protein PV08_00349 [Exophiala spinifera]
MDDDIPDLVDLQSQQDSSSQIKPIKKVPITIVTGYLGAGKTTLLNYILTAEHGKKIAVILNGRSHFIPGQFGNTADIEKSLTVNQGNQSTTEWIPLANGCICCSVKDSGVAALESLVERQKDFDYILLETTGVADPGNIAPMFWMDEGLGSSIYLDGIVTVVDAKNILTSLDEPAPEELPESESQSHDHAHDQHSPLLTTAHLQISHADVIILNKTDLVSETHLSQVQARITSINSLARLFPTSHSHIDSLSGTVLDLDAYSTFPLPPSTSTSSPSKIPDFSSKGHSHLDPTISTLTLSLSPLSPQDLSHLESWLETILWEAEDTQADQPRKYEVHRTKGLLPLLDGTVRVIQGVREIFDIIETPKSPEGSDVPQQGKIVFIGRNLDLLPTFSESRVSG